jgi:hypothetical protein
LGSQLVTGEQQVGWLMARHHFEIGGVMADDEKGAPGCNRGRQSVEERPARFRGQLHVLG